MLFFNYALYNEVYPWFLLSLAIIMYSGALVFLLANTVVALIFLLVLFLCTGILFVFFDAEFLGLVFLIVYAGAIAILFLFVIMLLDLSELLENNRATVFQTVASVFTLLALIDLVIFPSNVVLLSVVPQLTIATYITDIDVALRAIFFVEPLTFIGFLFYNQYSAYLLVATALLLLVLVGIVALLRTNLRQLVTNSSGVSSFVVTPANLRLVDRIKVVSVTK